MGIILFLVDTSASMCQRTFLGTTLIDIGKGAVETFIKLRQRDQGSRTDRYMLMTSEEMGAIKAGWKENLATFMAELKNIQATGLTNLGSALKQAFDLLNLYRLQSGIDNYGMGRNPFYVDPAMVICITDGGKLNSLDGVSQMLELPMTPRTPGDELTKEPFRWDQRLFSLLLKFPGSPHGFDKQAGVIADTANEYLITPMCEVTGGRSYVITSPKSLSNVLDSLVLKFQMGVVINFEKIGGPDKPPEASANPGAVNQTPEADGEGKPNHLNHVVKAAADLSGNGNQSGNEEPGLSPGESNMASRSNMTSPIPPTVQNNVWYNCRRLIYIKTNPKVNSPCGHWPIPESFWPENSMTSLEPRDADPTVLFSCVNSEPMIMDLLPFDKYELERSPLTQYILENVKPTHCWQTYISGSGKNSELGYPFGYLKASVNFNTVNLFVMPYNYPILIPLLDDLFKVLKLNPTPKWKQMFDKYLSDLPSYYVGPLRAALRRMGANAKMLIPDHIDGSLSYNVQSYFKKLKQQAKVEVDKMLASIGKKTPVDQGRAAHQIRSSQSPTNQKRNFHELLHNVPSSASSTKVTAEVVNVNIPESKEIPKSQKYKNPFDVKRSELLDQLARMRINFFHTAPTATRLQDLSCRHTVAVSQMGNYQDYLKQTNPLREIDPGMNRAHMFGNPFKLAKDQPMMVDEADVVNEAVAGVPSRKRRDSRSPPPSPRDRRRRGELSPNPGKRNMSSTPPVSPQENVNQQLPPVPQPVPHLPQPPGATGDKPTINNVHLNHNAKTTNPVSGISGKKRKLADTESWNEQRKLAKQIVNPQLRKLQQLHQNKLHSQGGSAFVTPLSGNKDKVESSKDISSILRNACMVSSNSSTAKMTKSGTKGEKTLSNHGIHNDDGSNKSNRNASFKKAITRSKAIRRICEDNSKLRQLICREIRTPGQDHASIFSHLEKVQGNMEKKQEFTRMIIDEATRFKKSELVEKLNTWLVTHDRSAEQNSRNHLRKNVNR